VPIEVLLNDVIDSALKVQSGDRPRARVQTSTFKYQLDALNADCSLADVITGLASCGQGRLCLYGPSGTGKSAFAQHVAKVLDKPALLKRASDIFGSFVGETERNMATMFREATADDAVLILDEADSFLREREGARRGWEITIVNEMLTQIEAFEGIFFATTNLMDRLDTACLRRFDMKINLGYLKFDQRLVLTKTVCKELNVGLTPPLEDLLRQLDQLTPGDFDNVLRQSRLRPIRTASDLIDRLGQEIQLKKLNASRPIGF
jgi:SpoVK/Ycf46/Vps4 family AAA+-type ATPase